ncbi:MAG: sodium:calcium antiporter [Gammaproteobacteria bacterium]
MSWAAHWPLGASLALFAASALVILFAGARMTRLADRLADVTGLGEAVFGAALLGGTTSLPGIIASVSAAAAGYPELAVSNAVGGIAAQTAFLAVADLFHRASNLEHAAASVENLVNGALLCGLLGLVLLASAGPQWEWLAVHPVSLLIVLGYAFGLKLAASTHETPGWYPEQTGDTRRDEPDGQNLRIRRPGALWARFALLAAVVGTAGYLVAVSGIAIVEKTGLSESVVGGLFTAIATSLPELVTSIAAVRQGALTLAVGGIIGGNTFDVLFIAFSDFAYRGGSIYHAISSQPRFVISLTIVLTSVLLLGLVRRERRGLGNIGFEGALVLALYLGGFLTLTLGFSSD